MNSKTQYQVYGKNHSGFFSIWKKGATYNSLEELYKANHPFYNNGDERVELVRREEKRNGTSIDTFLLVPHKDSPAGKNPDKFFRHFHSIKIVPVLRSNNL